ncbi:hypothetical protein C1645_832013 [Glomus cerebriforme]|uniref:Endonuclease/exonuclease/phosphatase domain-containing protein n=1 Tax=Glomus cerebriforme TaxID=658196 RepID=A0A397SF45_9GLOM|nr:hypothetical protein C1645_832013 [Glomus cerebriforme]
MVDTLQQQITQLSKESTFQKENITQINVKNDILINKIDDLTNNIKTNSFPDSSQTQPQYTSAITNHNNVHPNKTTQQKLTKNTFLTILKQHRMIDVQKTLFENPSPTFRHSSSKNSTSRIDYIFTSQSLNDYILNTENIKLPSTIFSTDHNLLTLTLDKDFFNFSPTSKTDLISNKKDFINYKQLTSEDWKVYTSDIKAYVEQNWQLSIQDTSQTLNTQRLINKAYNDLC